MRSQCANMLARWNRPMRMGTLRQCLNLARNTLLIRTRPHRTRIEHFISVMARFGCLRKIIDVSALRIERRRTALVIVGDMYRNTLNPRSHETRCAHRACGMGAMERKTIRTSRDGPIKFTRFTFHCYDGHLCYTIEKERKNQSTNNLSFGFWNSTHIAFPKPRVVVYKFYILPLNKTFAHLFRHIIIGPLQMNEHALVRFAARIYLGHHIDPFNAATTYYCFEYIVHISPGCVCKCSRNTNRWKTARIIKLKHLVVSHTPTLYDKINFFANSPKN